MEAVLRKPRSLGWRSPLVSDLGGDKPSLLGQETTLSWTRHKRGGGVGTQLDDEGR